MRARESQMEPAGARVGVTESHRETGREPVRALRESHEQIRLSFVATHLNNVLVVKNF